MLTDCTSCVNDVGISVATTVALSRLLGPAVAGSPLSKLIQYVTCVSTAPLMFLLNVVSTLAPPPASSRAIRVPSYGKSVLLVLLLPRSVALDTTVTSPGMLAVKPSSVPSSKSSTVHENGAGVDEGVAAVVTVLDCDAATDRDTVGVLAADDVGVATAGVRHRDTEIVGVLVAVAVLLRVDVDDAVLLAVRVAVAVPVAVGVPLREPVDVPDGVNDDVVTGVCVMLPLRVAVRVIESVGSGVCVHVGVSDTDADGDPDAVPDAEPEDVSDGDMVDDAVLVGVCPLEPLTVDVNDLLTVGVFVDERVRVRLRDTVGVSVLDAVCDDDRVPEPDEDAPMLGETDALWEMDAELEALLDVDAVLDTLAVADGDGVADSLVEPDNVDDGVAVGVRDWDVDTVAVTEAVPVDVGVADRVPVGVALDVSEMDMVAVPVDVDDAVDEPVAVSLLERAVGAEDGDTGGDTCRRRASAP